jgi:SAM-dependent methyltransferase
MTERVSQLYDRIGVGHRELRRPDPRIAAAILRSLAGSETVVNVGAGAGSYEPSDRAVVAVEPSMTMIRQRGAGNVPVVQASATELPFRDHAFAAGLAILTVHHWPDRSRGLEEMARVARERVVILTCDLTVMSGFWLVDDYFPEIVEADRRIFPSLDEFRRALGPVDVRVLPIPWDCIDGFLGAYWRRPHAYLDATVRSAISTFSKIRTLESRLTRLQQDLADGSWERRYGALLTRSELDLGYRLIVARRGL